MTSHNNGFGAAQLQSAKMADGFATLNKEKMAELLNDKDSDNTQKAMKESRLNFEAYLQEKNIRNPSTVKEFCCRTQ